MIDKPLTTRQQQILDFISKYKAQYGYGPIYEEISEAVGLSSTATIYNHLKVLETKGYIKRTKGQSRSIELLREQILPDRETVSVPIFGYINGMSKLQEYEKLDEKLLILRKDLQGVDLESCFALQVKGNDLVSEGLLPGDYIVLEYAENCKVGETVMLMLSDGATTIRKITSKAHVTELSSATNPTKNIVSTNPAIQGKVLLTLRKY